MLWASGSGIVALTGHTNYYNGFVQYHMPTQKNSSCPTEITFSPLSVLSLHFLKSEHTPVLWSYLCGQTQSLAIKYFTSGCFVGETGFLHCHHSPIQMDFCQYKVMHDLSLLLHPTPDADKSPLWGEKWAWICFWYMCKWGWDKQEESGKIYAK